jgi:hypothetical protein
MSSQVLTPKSFKFNSCLHFSCKHLYQDSQFANVQWNYCSDDPDSARKLFVNDEQFKARATSLKGENVTNALVVDSSSSWGGFAEDLASRAKDLGFDILVLQEYGDEEYNCGYGAAWTNGKACSLPIFRIASNLPKETMSSAQTVSSILHCKIAPRRILLMGLQRDLQDHEEYAIGKAFKQACSDGQEVDPRRAFHCSLFNHISSVRV